MTVQTSPDAVLGRETALRLGRVVRRFVTSEEVGGRAIGLAALLLALMVGINALNVVNSYVSRYFNEGRGRVRHLKKGFSPEECKAKLESPQGQELLKRIEKWYHDDGK